MHQQLDEVFSAERLRKNWELPTTVAAPAPHVLNQQIQHKFLSLQELISNSYADAARLSGRMTALSSLIEQYFPLDRASTPADAEQKMAVILQLEELEELLWALGLPGKDP